MAPTSVRRPRRPAPPEIPDDRQLTVQWRIGPPDAIVALEVWGRRAERDAILRLIDDAGSMDAGTVTAGGTDRIAVDWSDEARGAYGEDWLDHQARRITRTLALRWGPA